MKPSLTVPADVHINKSNVIQRHLKFWVNPDKTLTVYPKPDPAHLLVVAFGLLLSICNAQQITQGTTIVAVVTDTEIAVAADSRTSGRNGESKGRAFCKIQRSSDLFVACAHFI